MSISVFRNESQVCELGGNDLSAGWAVYLQGWMMEDSQKTSCTESRPLERDPQDTPICASRTCASETYLKAVNMDVDNREELAGDRSTWRQELSQGLKRGEESRDPQAS